MGDLSAGRAISVNKSSLLETLRQNLETHRHDFAEAMSGYKETRKNRIYDIATAAKTAHDAAGSPALAAYLKELDKAYHEYHSLEKPQDHSESYQQAIAVMEWETKAVVELTVDEFEKFVRDRWSWRHAFEKTLSTYTPARH